MDESVACCHNAAAEDCRQAFRLQFTSLQQGLLTNCHTRIKDACDLLRSRMYRSASESVMHDCDLFIMVSLSDGFIWNYHDGHVVKFHCILIYMICKFARNNSNILTDASLIIYQTHDDTRMTIITMILATRGTHHFVF